MTDRVQDQFPLDQGPSNTSPGSAESMAGDNAPRRNLMDDVRGDHDRAGAGGTAADSQGEPGGTLGTGGGRREQDN